MFKKAKLFHVEHLWSKNIKFKIHNPEVACDWIEDINDTSNIGEVKASYMVDVLEQAGWRDVGMAFLTAYFSFKRKQRLKDFDLLSILACPKCLTDLSQSDDLLTCKKCNKDYPYKDGIPNFG